MEYLEGVIFSKDPIFYQNVGYLVAMILMVCNF
jgi:hypothetical protein